jgi:hypothetical protein
MHHAQSMPFDAKHYVGISSYNVNKHSINVSDNQMQIHIVLYEQ